MNDKNIKLVGILCSLFAIGMISACMDGKNDRKTTRSMDLGYYPEVKIAGAMKNVMWKGELGSSIDLDTISNKKALYGLGPESYLRGEVLIVDGKSYVSKVTSDSTMSVEERFDISAPFLVYTHVAEWEEVELPSNIESITDLEEFIDQESKDYKRPFAFKLSGKITGAKIHVQNLPTGTSVSSPKEAHQGQTTFELKNVESEIVGFFSTKHQGVFTHHNSFLHMHLITNDKNKMGHLDELEIGNMKLYLPRK